MKKILIIAVLGVFTSGLFAQDSGYGLGLIVGEPTGFSAKMWLGSNTAIDAGLAWSLTEDKFHLHADYLIHSFELIPVEYGQLPLYFGVGANLGFGKDMWIGARVPLGLAYLFEDVPIDVFLEVAPGLALLPDLDFTMGGGIGCRYWF